MTELQEHILAELKNCDKPIHREALLARLHVRYNGLSIRQLKSEIEDMIKTSHIPIGRDSSGIYLIRTVAELQKAIAYLDGMAQSIAIGKNCLTQNFQEYGNDRQGVLL